MAERVARICPRHLCHALEDHPEGTKNFIFVDEDGKPFDCTDGEITYKVASPVYWTPETPKLYHFEIVVDGDKVKSYFALREFAMGKRKDGKPCFLLNGKPYFMTGLLDQGYWRTSMTSALQSAWASTPCANTSKSKACAFTTTATAWG